MLIVENLLFIHQFRFSRFQFLSKLLDCSLCLLVLNVVLVYHSYVEPIILFFRF